ncbi:glycerophosphodiester phosphodiesterase [Halobellus rufus]|uniref:glycerophosphodiester phosphodiesterase n=1 Tax=Halobellus rufus TaxID=1448860 RepID=UPI000679E526|nr:glycerophosphodiester phosphodiesterase [Halobellus rufus]
MQAIAHRGCLTQYPENTLRAFRAASAAVDMIELDVRRCGSGELVVFHDETLDRVTDATGEVAETDYDALKAVSVLGSGEPVPRLVDAFEVVPPSVGLNLELKGRDVAAEAVEVAADYDHEVIVSSFYPDDVADARDAGAPSIAFLFYDGAGDDGSEESEDETASDGGETDFDVDAALDVAADLGCGYVHPAVDLCLDTDVVARAHDRGFAVNSWTAADAETVRELSARGVDGVVIDDCELATLCREA